MKADIHIAELERAARRRIDWNKVHLAADKRKPFAYARPLTKLELMEGTHG